MDNTSIVNYDYTEEALFRVAGKIEQYILNGVSTSDDKERVACRCYDEAG